MIIEFEKDPIDLVAQHFGYSPEAAAEHYGAQCAKPRRWYEVAGVQYWATSRLDALDQCEAETGQRPSLDDVVEVV